MSDYALVEFQAVRFNVGDVVYGATFDDDFVCGGLDGKVFDAMDDSDFLKDIPVGEERKLTDVPFFWQKPQQKVSVDTETANVNQGFNDPVENQQFIVNWDSLGGPDLMAKSTDSDVLVEVVRPFVAVLLHDRMVDGELEDHDHGDYVSPIQHDVEYTSVQETFLEHDGEDVLKEALKRLGSKNVAAQFIALYEFECSGGGDDYESSVSLVGFPSLKDIALTLRYGMQRTAALDSLRNKVKGFTLERRYW
jgi:hypothetical protein